MHARIYRALITLSREASPFGIAPEKCTGREASRGQPGCLASLARDGGVPRAWNLSDALLTLPATISAKYRQSPQMLHAHRHLVYLRLEDDRHSDQCQPSGRRRRAARLIVQRLARSKMARQLLTEDCRAEIQGIDELVRWF